MPEHGEHPKEAYMVNIKNQPRTWHVGEWEGSMFGNDSTLSSLALSQTLCSPLPKGEAVGALRPVEEPADVQMGDEHL